MAPEIPLLSLEGQNSDHDSQEQINTKFNDLIQVLSLLSTE